MCIYIFAGSLSHNDVLNISAAQTVTDIALHWLSFWTLRIEVTWSRPVNTCLFSVQILIVRTENAGSCRNSPADTVCSLIIRDGLPNSLDPRNLDRGLARSHCLGNVSYKEVILYCIVLSISIVFRKFLSSRRWGKLFVSEFTPPCSLNAQQRWHNSTFLFSNKVQRDVDCFWFAATPLVLLLLLVLEKS